METTKLCSKCGGLKTGTQRYCIACWRTYDRQQRAAKRLHRQAEQAAKKFLSNLSALSPDARVKYADETEAIYEQFPYLQGEYGL